MAIIATSGTVTDRYQGRRAGGNGWDIDRHGLTWTNGLQVVGSLLGLGGNYTTWRRLPAGGAAARTPAPAASSPTTPAAADEVATGVAPRTGLVRNATAGGSFARGITAEEITAINRQLKGTTTLTGDVSTVLANAARQEGFWNKVASIVRDIAGRHLFNDANKRTAQAVVEELMWRNNITTGVSSDQMGRVIQ